MARKNDNKKGCLKGVTSRGLLLVAGTLLLLSYCSVFFNPSKAWYMALLGVLFTPFWLLNVFLFIWALLRRSRAFWIPMLCLLPSLFIVSRYYQFKGAEDIDTSGGTTMKVVSYNVGRFSMDRGKNKMKWKQCADSVMRLLSAMDPDIVCIQEYYNEDPGAVKSFFSKYFKGYDVEYFVYPTSSGCYGNVTLSRYPLKDKGKIDFDSSANLAIYSDYSVDGRLLRIYNCHLESYNISFAGIVKRLEKDYRSTLRQTEKKIKSSLLRRPGQVDKVMADIRESPVESFVIGDFNDTPLSYTYHRLVQGRSDSFVEAGKGAGATYAFFRPFLRIDYILFPSHHKAISHRVVRKSFSDHYPVVSEILLLDDPDHQ